MQPVILRWRFLYHHKRSISTPVLEAAGLETPKCMATLRAYKTETGAGDIVQERHRYIWRVTDPVELLRMQAWFYVHEPVLGERPRARRWWWDVQDDARRVAFRRRVGMIRLQESQPRFSVRGRFLRNYPLRQALLQEQEKRCMRCAHLFFQLPPLVRRIPHWAFCVVQDRPQWCALCGECSKKIVDTSERI